MNFPATGGISDDAQFFFEDYTFFYNATVNSQQQRIAPIIGRSEDAAASTSPPRNDVMLTGAAELGNSQTNAEDIREFSTVIASAMSQDRNNNQTGYAVPFEVPQQDQSPNRSRAQSISTTYEEKKSKTGPKLSTSNKVCRVCGDKALGYNFNVVTCESCKAFFRRNALKKKKLQCPFQNRCAITVSSRRYCQKCRLKKCFDVGMKAEYIMTEEQRAQKRQRLLERETMETTGGVIVTSPGHPEGVFFPTEKSETRNRYDSYTGTGLGETKPIVPSSKSSSASSEMYQQESLLANPTNIHSPIDVAAWVDDIQPQPGITLTSPTDPVTLPNTISASLEPDDDMITVRIAKSVLLGILFNNDDRTQQMTALGQAVVASATKSTSISNAVINGRSPSCVCPCSCSYGRTWASNQQSNPTSAVYPMDSENYYGALTAESGMAYSSMSDQNFGLFPLQEEPIECMDNNQVSLSNLQINDSTENQLALCPVGTTTIDSMTNFPVTSMDFDFDILNTLTSAFDVDWQVPLPFPSFGNLNKRYERLDELLIANNEEWNKNQCAFTHLRGASADDISTSEFYNLIHYALRCIIRQHSRLSSFKNLALVDQRNLIKANAREMAIFRSIFKYDERTEQVKIQYPGREFITLELAKRIRGGVYRETKELITSFPAKWRSNEALMLIMSALLLFNPESTQVVDKKAVEAEQNAYRQLLRDYLESTYGPAEAEVAFRFLLEQLSKLHDWANNYSIRVIFELDPRTMEPMLVQVYDFY